jgi:hypothetical protein
MVEKTEDCTSYEKDSLKAQHFADNQVQPLQDVATKKTSIDAKETGH